MNFLKQTKIYILTLIATVMFFAVGCKEKKEEPKEKPEISMAVESKDWNQLFIKNNGWFGGDGIFGIPLDGKEFIRATENTVTLFTFGDTMIGHHDGNTLNPEDFKMINNSFGILHGDKPDKNKITFHWKETERGEAKALFEPNTPKTKPGDYYWLGDGFVNTEGDNNLYVFAYPIHEKDTTGTGGFNFEQIGVNLIRIPANSKPPYDDHEQLETPFFESNTQTTFGSAVYVNTKSAGAPNPDGYIYIYAVSNRTATKGLLVARVLPKEFTSFSDWRFWNGTKWVEEMDEGVYIAEHVSNEMSVSPLPDGRIVITYQLYTMSPEVAVQIGESLVGPFGERQLIYHAKDSEKNKSYTTYNAKAYPHLIPKDSLLISYNVNSLDFWNDILKNPNLYRPRFLKCEIKQ